MRFGMSFLGRFLVEQGAITSEQLEDGLRFQRESNRRIGEVAMDRGLLTPEQVLEIRQRQQEDSRLFGDIAVGARRISRRSLDDLLFFQKVQHTYLGEALLVRGHIDREQYQRLMGRHYILRDNGRVSLRYLQEFFSDNRVLEILVAALSRVVRRFADEELAVAVIGDGGALEGCPHQGLLTGVVLGGRRLAARIGLSDSLASGLAAGMGAGESFSGGDVVQTTVLRYFGDMLRDASLLLEQGRVEREGTLGVPDEECLLIRFQTPTAEAGLAFWLEEADA
jgi:hypothetical protein